jgi:hypothetical protein
VRYIKSHAALDVDILEVAEAMERRSHSSKLKRTYYPPSRKAESAEDRRWHAPRNSSLRSAPTFAAENLNGLPIFVPPSRAIWLIENGTRRGFPNMDTFTNMGFTSEMCLTFYGWENEAKLPVGPPLPTI